MPRIVSRTRSTLNSAPASSKSAHHATDVLIVCGALGSGKTRFIEQLFSMSASMMSSTSSIERWALVVTELGTCRFYEVGSRDAAYYRLEASDRELFATVVGGGCVCCSLESSPAVVVLARTLRMLQPMKLMVIEVGLVTEVGRLMERVRKLGGAAVGEIAAVMLAKEEVLASLVEKSSNHGGTTEKNDEMDEMETDVMKMVGEHARGSRVAILWERAEKEDDARDEEVATSTATRVMCQVKEMCRAAGTMMLAGDDWEKEMNSSSLKVLFSSEEP